MAKKPIPQNKVVPAKAVRNAPRLPDADAGELPYPVIQHAANNSLLYPMDAVDGTVASIAFTGMGATPITLYWEIKPVEGDAGSELPTFAPIVVTGNVGGSVEIPIPWQRVSTCIGHTVLIWYTATKDGRLQQSLVLELEIQHVREADLEESRPVFEHATFEWSTWTLDMRTFQGDETISLKAWPLIQKGQRLFVTVAGDQHQTPYAFNWVAYDHVVTGDEAVAGHFFEFSLARGWLSRRQDYSALTVHLGVIWDGTEPVLPDPGDPLLENPLPTNAQDFHLRTTTLLRVDPALTLPPPHLKESVQGGENVWLVNPANTVNGAHIVVAYDGMHTGDIVCPVFSGTPGEGSPPLECRTVQEGETDLEFFVPPSAISANFGLPIKLTYSVRYNNTGPWHSPERQVSVLDISGLPTPVVEQATGNTLDLNTFNGDADCTVIPWPYSALDQPCWLWVTGVAEDGSALSFQVLEGEPVTEAWLTGGVNTALPRRELQQLADCSAFDVHFAVNFNGQSNKASAKKFPVLTLNIVQEDLVLNAPTVREAVGSQLTVYNGREGVTVRVAYERMSSSQVISVCWKRADGTCLPLTTKPGSSDPKHVDFHIPREAVIQGIGKTVAINYSVSSRCKLATSADLALQISVPVRLPTPVVPQATSGILDLRTFAGDADITLEKWWFILPGQVGWLECVGTSDEDGAPYTIRVAIAEPITQSEVADGLAKLLKRAELEKLRNRTSLVITYEATPDIGGVRSNAIVFPTLKLELRKAFDDRTDFDPANKGWNGWEKGAGATDPRDLLPKQAANGEWYLFDWGYTNASDPQTQREKLFKVFTGLEPGRTYEFSAEVRDNSGARPTPSLALVANGVEVYPATLLDTRVWRRIGATFTATSTTARLSIDNLQMGLNGNDFDVTRIYVLEK